MIVNVNDITLTDELLQKHEYTLRIKPTEKSIKNKDKFLYIDFSEADENIELDHLDPEYLQPVLENYKVINNRGFFGKLFRRLETKNEEVLWTYLVDYRLISDSVYQNNTYDENLDILFKNRKKD